MEWLWLFCGPVKVISTEYHDGVHYAKRPEHFLPIIDHLEQLHENGFVHGDIRAHNMVLNYPDSECELLCSRQLLEKLDGEMRAYNLVLDFADCQKLEGWLIDFDYGGKITTSENALEDPTGKRQTHPKYPKGYAYSLPDGLRLGKAGGKITFDHDWFALGYVILDSHELDLSFLRNNPTVEESRRSICYELKYDWPDKYMRAVDDDISLLEGGPAKFLRDYILLAVKHDIFLELNRRFKLALHETSG